MQEKMLNRQYTILYEDNDGEDCQTTAETLEEALEVRLQLIEDDYKNIRIESARV